MAIKQAILGVLMQGPAHGYRIKKIFAPFASKSGLNDGQVYPLLTQLEREELVRKETVRQQKTPNKNLYHITDLGAQEFLRWLTGPEDEVDPLKYDFFAYYSFLVKCNFFDHLTRKQRIGKLDRQIEAAREKIAEYKKVRDEMQESNLGWYRSKILEFGLRAQSLKIQWAGELLEAELKKGQRNNNGRVREKRTDTKSNRGETARRNPRSSRRKRALTG